MYLSPAINEYCSLNLQFYAIINYLISFYFSKKRQIKPRIWISDINGNTHFLVLFLKRESSIKLCRKKNYQKAITSCKATMVIYHKLLVTSWFKFWTKYFQMWLHKMFFLKFFHDLLQICFKDLEKIKINNGFCALICHF